MHLRPERGDKGTFDSRASDMSMSSGLHPGRQPVISNRLEVPNVDSLAMPSFSDTDGGSNGSPFDFQAEFGDDAAMPNDGELGLLQRKTKSIKKEEGDTPSAQ